MALAEGLEHPLDRLAGGALLELGGDRLAPTPRRWGWRRSRPRRSYRALPLAALDLVGAGAVPVDELLHRLEAELGGQRQLLDLPFEALGADPLGEGVELLASSLRSAS